MTDKPASTVRFLSYHDQMFIEDFGALVDIHQCSVSFFRSAKSTYGGLEYPEIEELIMKWRREVRVEGRKQMPPEGTLSTLPPRASHVYQYRRPETHCVSHASFSTLLTNLGMVRSDVRRKADAKGINRLGARVKRTAMS
jgi:hypothetical protein